MMIQVSKTSIKPGFQREINSEALETYTELMKEKGWGAFPPIEAAIEGEGYVILSGHHRFYAAQRAGLDRIPIKPVDLKSESSRWLYTVRSNANHGVRPTKADLNSQIRYALENFPEYTQQKIADVCQCSVSMVNRIKKRLESEGELERPETVIGENGRAHKTTYQTKKKTKFQLPAPPQLVVSENATSASEFVTCRECGVTVAKDMLNAADSTWEKRDYDPEAGDYVNYFCCEECLNDWEKSLESPERPLGADLSHSKASAGKNAQGNAKTASKRILRDLRILVPEGWSEDDLADKLESIGLILVEEKQETRVSEQAKDLLEALLLEKKQILKGGDERKRDEKENEKEERKEVIQEKKEEKEKEKEEKKKVLLRNTLSPEDFSGFKWTLSDGSEYDLPKKEYEAFKGCYQGIDLDKTLRECIAWSVANPKNRKTKSGILRHINMWLGKEQNRSRPEKKQNAFGGNSNPPKYRDAVTGIEEAWANFNEEEWRKSYYGDEAVQ